MKRKNSAAGVAPATVDLALADAAVVDSALVSPEISQGRTHVIVGRLVPLVQSSAGKVGPLAHQAADKIAPLTATAAERLNAAAVLVSPYATSAAAKVTPLAANAAGRVVPLAQSAAEHVLPLATSAVERVAPLRQQAVERVAPYAQQAAGFVTPYAQQAADQVSSYTHKVGPLATAAKERGVQSVHDAVEAVGPRLEDALAGVAPAVEAARSKVTDNLLPRVGDALTTAAGSPVVVEATKRGKATMAAARGDLTLPEPTPAKSRWLGRIAIIAALAGVAVVVVRKLLGSKDAGWQSARPSTPYVPSTPPTTTPTTTGSTDTVADADAVEEILPTDAVEPAAQTASAEPIGVDDPATASSESDGHQSGSVWTEGDVAGERPENTYVGLGAYVGAEPPEGFLIKGNEQSMKYHTPDSAAYEQTQAEVWFSSEEAAQEAGFVRAQG